MPTAFTPRTIAARLDELWSPRVVATLDDNYVKVAKVQGTFDWHAHEHEDELFYILDGSLRIDFADGTHVELQAGDACVVPKGVRHRPVAESECRLMLIEKQGTAHTGDVTTAHTRTIAEQLRPL
jgi:mannose-6-phosphate isomerase-like protein (cupin superfamily)